MTQDETNKLMGDAAAELRDVRAKLNCLTTKAEKYIKILDQASDTIKDSINNKDLSDAIAPTADKWFSVEQIETLCREIDEARTRRHKLAERMRKWGVID